MHNGGAGGADLLLHAALASMPYGFTVWNEQLRLVLWNATYLDMYHLPARRIHAGMTLREIAEVSAATGDHGALSTDEIHALYLKRFTAGAGPRVVEHRVRDRTIRSTNTQMPGLGWVVSHQDITEEVRQVRLAAAREQALADQNMRFDAAVNNMLHGLSMFDAENRLIICNRQYAELYGLREEFTRPGTSFWDILDERQRMGMVSIDDPTARFKALSAVIDAGRPQRQNNRLLNGRVIAVMHQPMAGGGWLSTHEDVTEQHDHEELIRHLARHDALTDLPNRVLFSEEMAKVEARIKRGENIAVLCVDLDNFKSINDSFGHAVGDGVLVVVAKRLREASRETDVVARLGGDEFAVVAAPLDDPKHAALIANRIVQSLAQPMIIEDKQIEVGASVGIAMAPVDGADADALLRSADLALYRAKSGGRGSYHFFEPQMDEALKVRRTLEHGLKAALGRGEFRLVFQPVLGLADNRICCLEALLRWDHPERGPIPPAEFIPVAEETGMIAAIGEWVLAEACRIAAAWPENVRVAVNLAAAQFKGRGVVDAVARALALAGLPPDRLELEVTEGLLLADPDQMFRALHRLRALGVRIVMDDFGSGYCSLSYLRTFPFNKLKIDRSFVAELSENGQAPAIVGAMIGLGRGLGMAIAAEGIETEAQLEVVRRQGCDEAQGFLLSPPLPASGIDALLGTVRAGRAIEVGTAG
jgi:diguanylate cyclase (GGDEF)-like protein